MLAAVARHPLVDEVIVVDDGSTDATADVAAAVPGVRLVRARAEQRQDRGAAGRAACWRGRRRCCCSTPTSSGSQPRHVTALLRPVLDGRADVAISLRGNAPRLWRLIGLDYISGERVLPMDLLRPHLGELVDLPPFAFEVWLNRLSSSGAPARDRALAGGARARSRAAKLGLLAGLRADAGMMRDIFRTVPPLARRRRRSWRCAGCGSARRSADAGAGAERP